MIDSLPPGSLLIFGANGGEAKTAVADGHGCHAMPPGQRCIGVPPGQGGVVVCMYVDESRRHNEAGGIDDSGGATGDAAHVRYSAVADAYVAAIGRHTGPVDNEAALYDQVIACHRRSAFTENAPRDSGLIQVEAVERGAILADDLLLGRIIDACQYPVRIIPRMRPRTLYMRVVRGEHHPVFTHGA